MTDEELARLQRQAEARAARNWDPNELEDMDGSPSVAAVDALNDGMLGIFESRSDLPFLGSTYLTEYLQNDHWKATQKRALLRAGGYCQRCHQRGLPLDVHHLTYRNLGRERESDLLVLCRDCHQKEHQRRW